MKYAIKATLLKTINKTIMYTVNNLFDGILIIPNDTKTTQITNKM
jgi:hypothetical protein